LRPSVCMAAMKPCLSASAAERKSGASSGRRSVTAGPRGIGTVDSGGVIAGEVDGAVPIDCSGGADSAGAFAAGEVAGLSGAHENAALVQRSASPSARKRR
jgi:hypothetical protein